ncbi:hypothetical protein Vretifemale_6884, partial [Volvox reticuliferus]
MLCCFGRPVDGPKPLTPPQAASAQEHDTKVTKNAPMLSSGIVKFDSPVYWTPHRDADIDRQITEEPWHTRLSERLAAWVSCHGLQAAGCWVCARERGKCALVAAAPSAKRNAFRSAIHGFFLGSTIDLTNDKSSSIACAISTKVPVSVVVLANGQALGDMPVDLRQLYERLCRTFANLRVGQSNMASASIWHLAALPLMVQDEAVGALVLAGPLDIPTINTSMEGSRAKASVEAAAASRLSAAVCLADEFFGTTASLTCAQDVVALVTAVSDASDHGAAVRNAAAQIQALLPRPVFTAASPNIASSPSYSGSSPGTVTSLAAAASTPVFASSQELIVTTGLVVSRGTMTRSCTPNSGLSSNIPAGPNIESTCIGNSANSASGAGGGPQLHLYHGSNGRPGAILPVSETLITRAPIQADMLAAMLNEALAAPVSSAALAATAAKGPGASPARGGSVTGPQQQHKLLTLRCPEEDLPPSQQRADLLALEAAGVRTPRGSVVLVSCPLSNIMCAVVVYVCAVSPHVVEATVASDCSAGSAHGLARLAGSRAVAVGGDCDKAPQMAAGSPLMDAVQLADAQLKLILMHASSAVEIMANALEQRIISSCAVSPTRLGSKGPCAVDVTADGSGLVTVSMAGTDGDDSNGFWGSASGPILSGESIPTSQLSAAATTIPSTSPGVSAMCLSVGRSPAGRAQQGTSDFMKFTPAVKSPTATAAAAMAPRMASPLASSSSAAPQIQNKAVCNTNDVGSSGDLSSAYLITQAAERNVDGGTATLKAAAVQCAVVDAVNRSAEQLKPGPGTAAATGTSLEPGFISGPDTATVPPLTKLPSIGSRPVAKVTLNDTDASQDTEVDGGAVDTALPTVAATTVDAEVRGASASAAASSSSASGFSGVESTIQALTCDHLDGDCVAGRPPQYQRHTADVQMPAQGQELPKVLQLMTGDQMLALRARALQPCARHHLSSCDGNGIKAVFPSHSNSITLETLATAAAPAVSATTPIAAAQQGGAYNKPLAEGGVQTVRLEDGVPPMQHFSISSVTGGGSGAASVSGEQLSRTMVRNRSKDWSDQAGEPDGLDGRFVPGGCTGGASAQRIRPVKVLSLDKAAQQLQRTSGSSLGMVLQQMPVPAVYHHHNHHHQQSFGPQNSAGATAQDNKDDQSAGCSVAALGTTPAATPPPYTPYMPRRLNRMYLPPTALAMSGAGGMPVAAVGVLAKAAMIARPNGATLQTPTSEATAPQPSHLPHLIHLTARAIRLDGSAMAVGAPAVTVHPAIGQPSLPAALPDGVVHPLERNSAALGSTPSVGFEQANPALLIPQAQAHVMPPSAVAAGLAAHVAAVRAGGVGADMGIGSLLGTASSQKSHQLRDFIIPEDAPLEYTVSETVQMMRMLAQARGAHLSSRMRRVRVTAKIQSAHPESLPTDLPSQLSKVALPQSVAAGSTSSAAAGRLFSAVGRGPAAAASGSWVLTGVAARRGCIELVFDVVQVRGSSGGGLGGNVYKEQQDAVTPASRRWPAAVSSGGSRGLQGTGQGPGFSSGSAAAVPHPQTSGQPGTNAQGYRRWQGAGADALTDTMGIFDDLEDAATFPMERIASAAPKSPAAAAAAGEQLWLRNVCGVRPEAVGEVLNCCGLLNPGGDPVVDIQIGHTAAGAGTLVWHEATGQWMMASTAGGAPPAAVTTGAPSSCYLEAPTLWLPTAVVLLARGARVLQDIRVVSTAGSSAGSRSDVVDELTVRSACGYLPIRTAAGIRMHAGGGGSGSSVPPLPLLLEDDPVVESLVDSSCVWRLVDVGGALPRNGGLLLVECRRTTPAIRRLQGSLLDLPHGGLAPTPVPAVVTSAPVPLLVLPEQQATAAMELQRLRIYMA